MSKLMIVICMIVLNINVSAQVKFAQPLQGVSGQDYWIVNYVDHDITGGLLNYACSNKTYDGHEGTDYVLRSFKTMDSGIVVYAMADGIVFKTKDSLFDRSKVKNNLGLGNYVAINHSGEYWAYYGHLRKLSLLVKVGDTVKEGEPIGTIGSSGNSTDPHLHLEVYDINSKIVDPFAGACQTNTASAWKSQLLHDTSLVIIDKGFTAYVPHLDTLRERYDIRDTIYTGTDTSVNFWIQLQGIRAGDSQRVDWYTPNGAYWFSFGNTVQTDYWYYYFWTYINIPNDSLAGRWNAKYYINNQLVANEYVQVAKGVGINDVHRQADWAVYPNPANSFLYIRGDLDKELPVELYNMQGALLKTYSPDAKVLDIASLQHGMYLIKQAGAIHRFAKH